MNAAIKRKRVQRVRQSLRPQESRPETWAEKARRSNWLFVTEMVAVVLTILGLLFAGYGLYQAHSVNDAMLAEIKWANEERKKEALVNEAKLEEIEEARIQRNIEFHNVAVDPNTARTARKQALEFLVANGQSLAGIDLSCETVGNPQTQENGNQTCWRIVDPLNANLEGAQLSHINLQGADLFGANLKEATLIFANLEGAALVGVNLKGAFLQGANLQRAFLSNANLATAVLAMANLKGANLDRSNLSHVNFSAARNLESASFKGAWAWADQLPKNLPIEIDLCVYDEDIHNRSIKPVPCITKNP